MRRVAPTLLLAVATLACGRRPAADQGYAAEVRAAREKRVAELTSEDGWLTLVARQELAPGENRIGSDPSSAVALEAPGIPPKACTLDVRPDGTVLVRAEPGAPVAVNGVPPGAAPLVPERSGAFDVVSIGRVRLTVFEKDGRLYARARDPESARRKGFRGLEYFPIDPSFRIEGRYEPYPAMREVDVPSSRGPARKALAPGLVRFELRGSTYTLEPTVESPADDSLFFVFADATSGTETYGGGRFLYAKRPAQGGSKVVLDFNLAENPPCSLTPYASCPMALPKNTLPLRIEAGEKAPPGH